MSMGYGCPALLAAAMIVPGCVPSSPTLGADQCRVVIWARPKRPDADLSIVGSWNDWGSARAMGRFAGGWRVADFGLPPGDYGYLVVEDAETRLDAFEPLSTYRRSDGQEVSWLQVPDCFSPSVSVDDVQETDPGVLRVSAHFVPARDGSPLDPHAIQATADTRADVVLADAASGSIRVEVRGLERGRHHVALVAADTAGVPSDPADAVGWVQPRAPERDDAIIYQIVIDRFRGDGGAVLDPPATPGSRAGGTFDGIRAEIEAGTFEMLGVSTLWLSPVYTNPDGAREGVDGHLYDAYHGYWPLASRGVDPRLGGEEGLRALVQSAHDHGLAVLLDLVPNHVYEENPRYLRHRADGWFHEHEPPCVCGTPTCSWAQHIEDCWFTSYLPDVRFEQPDALAATVDDAQWWFDTFDVDGFRIDAVPMMPRAATRRVLHAVRAAAAGPVASLQLGEIFTGPGPSGTEAIRYHLGPDGLDSAFDFPLMWALRDALAHDGAGFDAVDALLGQTETAIAGSGSIMAPILGNHDTTRFISEIVGDAGHDPWGSEPAVQPTDAEPYRRQTVAFGLLLTLPGIPVVYYGDEIGLAGGSDPGSRRVMPDLAGLAAPRQDLLATVRRLGTLRRCSTALRRGKRVPFAIAEDVYGFVRDAGDGRPAFVVVSRHQQPQTLTVPASVVSLFASPGTWVDAPSGDTFDLGGTDAELPLEPWSIRVLVPAQGGCAP